MSGVLLSARYFSYQTHGKRSARQCSQAFISPILPSFHYVLDPVRLFTSLLAKKRKVQGCFGKTFGPLHLSSWTATWSFRGVGQEYKVIIDFLKLRWKVRASFLSKNVLSDCLLLSRKIEEDSFIIPIVHMPSESKDNSKLCVRHPCPRRLGKTLEAKTFFLFFLVSRPKILPFFAWTCMP